MTTALVRRRDAPLTSAALLNAYQAGRASADIEHRMVVDAFNMEGLDLNLNRALREIDIKTFGYNSLQQQIFDRAHDKLKEELAPVLQQLMDNMRPYWETHDTLVVQEGPGIERTVILGEVPREMLERFPQYSPIPRQEEFHFQR